MRCLLIQANGNNNRMGYYFKQPKYELYFRGSKIIDKIIENSNGVFDKIFVAVRKGVEINFNSSMVDLIYCERTESRIDTLKNCFDELENYESVTIHDCDVVIDRDVLEEMKGNSLAVASYKGDGLKYGFIELDRKMKYLKGNEKEKEEGHVSIGAYSVDYIEFNRYLEKATNESLLEYYNLLETDNIGIVYSKNHINLGDIQSYIDNLWSL
jgi:hypothetical protein